MIETVALLAIGTGVVVLLTSTIAALGIVFSPPATGVSKGGVQEDEYQDRFKHDYDAVRTYYGYRRHSRPFSPKMI